MKLISTQHDSGILEGSHRRASGSHQMLPPSRRSASRIKTSDDVWVYWQCNGREETSRVLDLSVGGLFVETVRAHLIGSKVQIDFLVREGQIRAEAVVRRLEPGRGLGLKFTTMNDKDRPHMASLITRLRSLGQ